MTRKTMSMLSSVLGRTVGHIVPKFRTLRQWEPIYRQIIQSRNITQKTRDNRKHYMNRIFEALGDRPIGAIRPHEIGAIMTGLYAEHPSLSRRILIEAKDIFNQALLAGWIDQSPAETVKMPILRIARRRLSLDHWRAIHDYADDRSPPWVVRMVILALVTGQRRGDLLKMRFSDVWHEEGVGDCLHIVQEKTGTMVAIPLDLRLDAIDWSVRDAIDHCRRYAPMDSEGDGWMLRKTTSGQLEKASLSMRFAEARTNALPPHSGTGDPASLHECRSLAERLYREQGVPTKWLLGHANQIMTDLYNRDRGLSKQEGKFKVVPMPASKPIPATENVILSAAA